MELDKVVSEETAFITRLCRVYVVTYASGLRNVVVVHYRESQLRDGEKGYFAAECVSQLFDPDEEYDSWVRAALRAKVLGMVESATEHFNQSGYVTSKAQELTDWLVEN